MDHVVGFLLVPGFKDRDQCKFSVDPGVLFILRRMHGWVVGRDDDHPAVRTGYGGIDKGVGGHIETDVLHANHGPLTGI